MSCRSFWEVMETPRRGFEVDCLCYIVAGFVHFHSDFVQKYENHMMWQLSHILNSKVSRIRKEVSTVIHK